VSGVIYMGRGSVSAKLDLSPPPCDEVKNGWSFTATPRTCFGGVVINRQMNIFTLFAESLEARPTGLNRRITASVLSDGVPVAFVLTEKKSN
jgi:hypothetical protein